MNKYVLLLRGINVSGKNKIKMSDLKEHLEMLGFSNIQTYIQSGNIILQSEEKLINSELENKIETGIEKRFDIATVAIARTESEWSKLIKNNPYIEGEEFVPEKQYFTFLKENPDTDKLKKLKTLDFKSDQYTEKGKEIFIQYHTKYSDSKLNNNLIENNLKVKATTRNYKTVQKLAEMLKI